MQSKLSNYFGFGRFLVRRMVSQRVMQVAGSLTFTTLLALVPLMTIMLTVMSAFPVFAEYSNRIKLLILSNLVPQFAGRVISVYMRQFADNAEKLTAVGILMLGVTSLMLMATIERTFNSIWGVWRARPWMQQSMVYWSVLSFGPAILGGGLWAWRWLFRVTDFERVSPLLNGLLQTAGTVALTALALIFLYRVVPNRFVPMRDAVWGGVVTAVLLEATKFGFAVYIGRIASYQLVYGAFASLPIFLLWVYCLWLVVLAGAVLTASLSYWEGAAWKRRLEPRRRFLDAVEVLLLLDKAQENGWALTPRDLRRQVKVGYDELGMVLDKLAAQGWVQRGPRDSWVLMRKLSTIRLLDVFRLFVFRAEPERDDEIGQALEGLLSPMTDTLDVSLEAFARRVERK
ncbi:MULTISPECIES: YihY family inner membrane protein [Gulbenkiania]|uniref:UPF0761 membrane protein Ga0061063_0694 n=2 Tax=Gulbenkiania TaxID=397456 RepID=A0A0K6GT89_9NEIS|nr:MULTISPECIES: YihY family inner membrane protein [Gulbenkiania]TCW31722.1 membrane protein [Gulbenkiania mobilis]CUA81847.1 tRNA-processing RNAse BN [Gulbenkiania indica]